jgi:hypothetical protein
MRSRPSPRTSPHHLLLAFLAWVADRRTAGNLLWVNVAASLDPPVGRASARYGRRADRHWRQSHSMSADALAVLVGRRAALTVLAPDTAFSVLAPVAAHF